MTILRKNPRNEAELRRVIRGTEKAIDDTATASEPALGNPSTNADCLVSTTTGTRSWSTRLTKTAADGYYSAIGHTHGTLHTQGTDTGTTGTSFTVDSGATTGKLTIQAVAGAADKTLTLKNAALTADRDITFPDATGTAALTSDISTAMSTTPVALTFATPLVAAIGDGKYRKTTATSAFELDPPTGGAEGDRLELWITCDGTNRDMTIDAAILIGTDSGITSPKTLTASKRYIVVLKYSGSAWMLDSITGGF